MGVGWPCFTGSVSSYVTWGEWLYLPEPLSLHLGNGAHLGEDRGSFSV